MQLPRQTKLIIMTIFPAVYKSKISLKKALIKIIALFMLIFSFGTKSMAQKNNQMVRLVSIKVDPPQLDKYNAALKEQMTTAIRVEPGVLTYYAVANKNDPASITILEIYASPAAYKLHVAAPHFKKYKDTVKDMVKSLEIVDVSLIGLAKKPGA